MYHTSPIPICRLIFSEKGVCQFCQILIKTSLLPAHSSRFCLLEVCSALRDLCQGDFLQAPSRTPAACVPLRPGPTPPPAPPSKLVLLSLLKHSLCACLHSSVPPFAVRCDDLKYEDLYINGMQFLKTLTTSRIVSSVQNIQSKYLSSGMERTWFLQLKSLLYNLGECFPFVKCVNSQF